MREDEGILAHCTVFEPRVIYRIDVDAEQIIQIIAVARIVIWRSTILDSMFK